LFTRELMAIIVASAAGFFAQEILNPILSLYMRDIGLSDQNIGAAISVMMVGIALSELFWGWAVDRIQLKAVLILGMFVYALMTSALLIPKTIFPLFVVIFFYGFSRSPVYIVGRWYMGVHAAENVKAQAFALMSVMIAFSSSVAGFSSGFITEAWGFRTTIRIAAVVPFAAGLFIIVASRWFRFRHRDFKQADAAEVAHDRAAINGNAKPMTYFLGAFGVIMFISLGVFMAYLPLFATDVVHLDPSQIGTFFGARSLFQALAMLPLSKLADKVGKRGFVPLSMAVVAASMILLAVSRSYGMLMASVVLYALGFATYMPSVTAILSERVPVSWIGTAMGIYGLLEDVGWMLGPAVASVLLNYWSVPSTFVFSGVAAALGAPLFQLGWQRVRAPKVAHASAQAGAD